MQIAVVHNHYRLKGGEDESYQSELRVLREAGHIVEAYTEHNDRVTQLGQVHTAMRSVWAGESYRRIRALLRTAPFDVLHVQNFFPLISPSVYYAARAEGVPVVQSLRNYRLLCPNALFFRDGQVCERCMGKLLTWPGVVHGCYKESRGASLAVSAMIVAHRLVRTWSDMVDRYIALSEFARRKFIEGGLPAEKIVVKPNFVHPDPGLGAHSGGYCLFVGRLSSEKGTATLLAAWEQLGARVPLRVVGDGPLRDEVRALAARLPGVEYLGPRRPEEVYALMGEACALIMPSEWYETFGRVVVEAFAKGTPVIAADIGAVAELVDHGRTGLLFTPGDPASLAAAVAALQDRPEVGVAMGREARAEYEAKYTAQQNLAQLTAIYADAMRFAERGRTFA